MSLINCPECNHEVSDQAATCPNCGYILKTEKTTNVTSVASLILLFYHYTYPNDNYNSWSSFRERHPLFK